MNIKERAIRIALLSIIVILGLLIVFPQAPELLDFIIAEKKQNISNVSRTLNADLEKAKSWSIKHIFAKNVAPNRDEILIYLLTLPNIKKVECIGDIPIVTYDKDQNKTSPDILNIPFQVIALNENTPQSQKGILYIKPNLHSKTYGHLLSWLDTNSFQGWNYRHKITGGGTLHSQTRFSTFMKNLRVQKCSF